MRRRLYLMRHGEVSYYEGDGSPIRPDDVPLTDEGRTQAGAAAALLAGVAFDRVITSGLRRTVETAEIVAPGARIERWPELEEIRGDRISALPEEEREEAFVGVFRGMAPLDRQFFGGETIGELLDRVLPALDRLLADETWDTVLAVLHGGVNRAILSFALTGERTFFGHFEQAAGCINVLDVGEEWIVRAVGVTPLDLTHSASRLTTMERYWTQYRRGRD